MKKNVFWMALISLVVMMSSTVLTSCDKEDDEKDGSLIGEWIDEDEVHYIFNEDGTWRTFSNDPADLWSEEGTYVYKGGVIYFDSDDEEFLEAKVIKLTATELILEIAEEDGRTSRLNLKRTVPTDDEKGGSLDEALVGAWSDGNLISYVFNADGTWKRSINNDNPWSIEGTCTYKDGVIYFYSDGEFVFEAKVIKLTDTELVLDETFDGETVRVTLKKTSSSTNGDDDDGNDNGDDDDDDDVIQDKTLTVTVENGASYSGIINIVKVVTFSYNEDEDVPVLSVPYNNGVFTLKLPDLDDQYISIEEDEVSGVTVSDPNVKVSSSVDLYAYKSNADAEPVGSFYYGTGDWLGRLVYVDRNVSITGSHTETYGEVTETDKYNYNLQKGWNMVYGKETKKAENLYEYELTSQAPAGAKWYFVDYYSASESGSLRKHAPSLLSAKRISGFIK